MWIAWPPPCISSMKRFTRYISMGKRQWQSSENQQNTYTHAHIGTCSQRWDQLSTRDWVGIEVATKQMRTKATISPWLTTIRVWIFFFILSSHKQHRLGCFFRIWLFFWNCMTLQLEIVLRNQQFSEIIRKTKHEKWNENMFGEKFYAFYAPIQLEPITQTSNLCSTTQSKFIPFI